MSLNIIFFYTLLTIIILQVVSSPLDIITKEISLDSSVPKFQCYEENNDSEGPKSYTYKLKNSGLNGLINFQFKNLNSFTIYETEDKKHKAKNTKNNYYFKIRKEISEYFLVFKVKENTKSKLCMSFLKGNGSMILDSDEQNSIKKFESYETISQGKFIFYMNNKNIGDNKLFGFRINKNKEIFKKPKINVRVGCNDKNDLKFNLTNIYSHNNFYYFPLKINFENCVINYIYINVILKYKKNHENNFDEKTDVQLELIDTQEINDNYALNIKNITNKILVCNLNKHLKKDNSAILFKTNDETGKYIKSFLTTDNNETIVIKNESTLINNKNLKQLNFNKTNLLFTIIDNKNNTSNDLTIDIQYYENSQNISFSNKIQNNNNTDPKNNIRSTNDKEINPSNETQNTNYTYLKNEISSINVISNDILKINETICSNQSFINANDYSFLECESISGKIKLFDKSKPELNNKNNTSNNTSINTSNNTSSNTSINTSNNSSNNNYILKSPYCKNNPKDIFGYLFLYKKNSVSDNISFINRRSLLYIEPEKPYSINFDESLKNSSFAFRIKILNKPKGKFFIKINYDLKEYIYHKKTKSIFLKHLNESDNTLKIDSILMANTYTKGFIIEILQNINKNKKNITYLNKENNGNNFKNVIFVYGKNMNTSSVKFDLNNENTDDAFVCIHKNEGKYPFIKEAKCNDDEKIKINKNSNYKFMFDNPYCNKTIKSEDYYLSIVSDKSISIKYNYEKSENKEKKKNVEEHKNINNENDGKKKEEDKKENEGEKKEETTEPRKKKEERNVENPNNDDKDDDDDDNQNEDDQDDDNNNGDDQNDDNQNNGNKDEKKQGEKKQDENKQEEKKQDENKPEERKQEEKKQDENKPEEKKQDENKSEENKKDENKPEEKKQDENKSEEKKQDEKKQDENKKEENKSEENKKEEKKQEENKSEEKKDENKKEENKSEEEKPKNKGKMYLYYEILPCYNDFKNVNDELYYLNMVGNDKHIPYGVIEEFKENLLKQINEELGSDVCRVKYKYTVPGLLSSKNNNFDKTINFVNENNNLKFSLETPYYGEIEINTIFLTKSNLKFDNNCALIDYKNKLKEDTNNVNEILIEKTAKVEPKNPIKFEISEDEVKDIIKQKDYKILVITKHKKLNFEISYNPYFNNKKYKNKLLEEKITNLDITTVTETSFFKYIIYIGIALFVCLIICIGYRICRCCRRKPKRLRKNEENTSFDFEFY